MGDVQARSTVVSVRVDPASLKAIDLLVRAGLAQSRSEAAAQFVAIGIRSADDLLARAREVADELQGLKRDLLAAIRAKDVAGARAVLAQNPGVLKNWTSEGETPVLTAIYSGANELTQMLLEQGAELSVFEATAIGDAERVARCLDADPALIGAYSHDGWTLLHMACYFGHGEVARLLVERGASVASRSRNELNNTPLHSALAGRRHDVARWLIDAGADIHSANGRGWTPLHHAAGTGHLATLKLLVARGARTDARNQDGHTPAQVARDRGYGPVADWLESQVGHP